MLQHRGKSSDMRVDGRDAESGLLPMTSLSLAQLLALSVAEVEDR